MFFLWLTRWASDSLLDFINQLWENIEFGYITDIVEVEDITDSQISFKSPFILDWSWSKINKYRIMYSPKSLDEMTDDASLLNQSMEKQFTITNTSTSTFSINLNKISDNLSGDKIYYALIIPEDSNWIFWNLSNEICFKLDEKIYWEWNDCINWNWISMKETHNAWADMSLANISFTRNWNTITLRWIAIEWSDEVELFLFNWSTNQYTKLATVDIIDEEYSFTTTRNWEHRVKFIPDNGWTEHIYTFQVSWIWTTPPPPPSTPWVPSVPKVWPTENIIALLILTFAIYFIYRKAKRQS